MKDLLQYKGYYGSIEASTEDNCLLGKLLFIRALVKKGTENSLQRLVQCACRA